MRRSTAGAIVLAVLFAGCGSFASTPAAPHAIRKSLVPSGERLLVVPLREGSPLPIYGNHVMCHLTGEHLDAGEVPEGAGAELSEILSRHLAERGVELVPSEEARRLFSGVGAEVRSRYEPSLGVELGRRAGASRVVMGILGRYEERSGSWFASAEPAKVSFSLALVDVESGSITHKHLARREQAPLTANLLALPVWWRQGFRWWTRREVADEALAEAAAALAGAEGSETAWPNMPAIPSPRFKQW